MVAVWYVCVNIIQQRISSISLPGRKVNQFVIIIRLKHIDKILKQF